ncbi:MAG: DUF1292 domain-containing protein [Clostridia bacterium]
MSERIDDENIFDEVVLLDEDGKEAHFDHVMTFLYEKERYVALMPLDEDSGLSDDEVLILKIETRNGEDIYVPVENDILLDEVFNEFISLLEDDDDDEEG